MNIQVHLTDNGTLRFIKTASYDTIPGEYEVFQCEVCGKELEVINDYDIMGTPEQFEYFKSKGWKSEHGNPFFLYPYYPREGIDGHPLPSHH